MNIRKPSQFPLVTSEYAPADYVDEYNRGTVEYDEAWSNYSFHKVSIPEGMTIKGDNFCQWKPGTDAISGDNLTFVGCNLTNVLINKTWTLVNCMNQQVDLSQY